MGDISRQVGGAWLLSHMDPQRIKCFLFSIGGGQAQWRRVAESTKGDRNVDSVRGKNEWGPSVGSGVC